MAPVDSQTVERWEGAELRAPFDRGEKAVEHPRDLVGRGASDPGDLNRCMAAPVVSARVGLNGHEWANRQLAHQGIGYEALDNGFFACDDAETLQTICDSFSAGHIETFFRKWLRRLPHPFTAEDRKADFRYELSILQHPPPSGGPGTPAKRNSKKIVAQARLAA